MTIADCACTVALFVAVGCIVGYLIARQRP